jgi:hypothetical protein
MNAVWEGIKATLRDNPHLADMNQQEQVLWYLGNVGSISPMQAIDMFGITKDFHPRFLRRYLDLFDMMKEATEKYIDDVKTGDFPNANEQY